MYNSGLKFELQVKSYLEKRLKEEFQKEIPVFHRKKYVLPDGGAIEIDLSYEFQITDFNYLVLIECKDWSSEVDRDQVFTLAAKVEKLNAHKGILISGKGFQKGAISLAKEEKIGLMKVANQDDTKLYSNFTTDFSAIEKSLEVNSNDFSINSGIGLIEPKGDILLYLDKKFKPKQVIY